MAIQIDLSTRHSVVAANAHYYKDPTDARYIDRTLQYHDLIYMVEGQWGFSESDREYSLSKGDVLLLSAGLHHFTRQPCSAGTRTFCIHVTCEPGDNPPPQATASPRLLSLPTHLHTGGSPEIKGYFERILSTYWQESPYRQEALSALLDLLFVALSGEFRRQEGQHKDIAARAMEIVTATPHRRFPSREVAQMLYVSTRTLDNAMHRATGMPFYTYQKNRKLEMVATQLVMEPDLRLREIATAFGFHDEFHMSKAFKQKYGIPPQEYRQQKLREAPAKNLDFDLERGNP